MLTRADFESRLVATLDDPDIAIRYQAGDPIVVQQIRANAAYLTLLAQDIEVATIEPFIKTRDRSILADATNKGILPVATPCQHVLEVINKDADSVALSQGRFIEDGQGRVWRLLASVTAPSGSTVEVVAEQSELRQVVYTVPITQTFARVPIDLRDDLLLAGITVQDDATPTPNVYRHAPRWMNVAPLDYAVTVTTDSLRRVLVEFGDDARAGRTVQSNQQFTFAITECYGAVDTARLKDAALVEVLTPQESKVSIRFKQNGLVRSGANPLTIGQLRLLASYPALYDENAVFLGNFDYLVRQKFMARTGYLSVWNEAIQERAYGSVSFSDINRLHLAVVANNPNEQTVIEGDIKQLIGRADSLYLDRVRVHSVVERPYQLTINGTLAAVHDIDSVAAQIRGLLLAKYGKGTIATSRWMPDGINRQEVSTLIRNNIAAFQDRISDFVVSGEGSSESIIQPHHWSYLTSDSIAVSLTRTADTGGSLWTL